jgi:long-chain acyl-CoA synthetase
MTNLAANLERTARRHPDRPAVRLDDEVLTYADLCDLSGRVVGWLRHQGIRAGDRVGLMLPNVIAFPVLYYGILRAGGVVVPMNPLLKRREVQHYLGDSGARLILASPMSASEASAGARDARTESVTVTDEMLGEIAAQPPSEEIAARADQDTAVILYTSGTTGTPKGAELTHANMRTNALVTATTLLDLGADDVVMGCLPMFHSFGQTCCLNTAVLVGASVTLVPRFDPATALKVIERDRVTVFEGVPTMYVGLVNAGTGVADTATLRLCVSGGAALPVEVLRTFKETFGAQILEGYGLSETSPVASFNRPGNARPGSIGFPIEGVEMRVVNSKGDDVATGDVGEIVIRGHNVMKGYWDRPEATAEAIPDGWFRTGDLAKKDDDGFFYIVDRNKDLIIRDGYNVYPREIEEVLYEHPAVLEAAVIGLPDPMHGEEVGAAVVLQPGGSATCEELHEYVGQRVAPYKCPRRVWLTDALPKGATGKILKREVTPPVGLS